MKLLLYCTKEKDKYDRLVSDVHYGKPFYLYGAITKNFESLNGKIVAECDFEVEEIEKFYCCGEIIQTKTMCDNELLGKSYLSFDELQDYLQGKNGYAINIKNLHIFDEPKELNEVYKIEDIGGMLFTKPLTNAPQNMMRVSVNHWEYATYTPNDINILISIRPEWLCKILNGEKTIEVRKKVLKEMLK